MQYLVKLEDFIGYFTINVLFSDPTLLVLPV